MTILSPARVRQTTITTGAVDPYILGSASAPFRNFVDVYPSGSAVPYCAADNSSGFEIGIGPLLVTGHGFLASIARTTVLLSSNRNAAVNWGNSIKEVFAWDLPGSLYVKTFAGADEANLSDWGNTFVFTGAALGSLALPKLSTVPRGFTITLKASGTAGVYATPYPGDQIETFGSGTAYLQMPGSFAVYATDLTVWRQVMIAAPPAPQDAGLAALAIDNPWSGLDGADAWCAQNPFEQRNPYV